MNSRGSITSANAHHVSSNIITTSSKNELIVIDHIVNELLHKGHQKQDIIQSIKDVNARLSWNICSLCLIYARSKQTWFEGKVMAIFVDDKTNQEWLRIKYNDKRCKNIQRFNPYIKPTHSDCDYTESIYSVIAFIANKLKPKTMQTNQLIEIGGSISRHGGEIKNECIDLIHSFTPNIDIDKIIHHVLKEKMNQNVENDNHYAYDDTLDGTDKQIDTFDLVLQYVEPVSKLSTIAFQSLLQFYLNEIKTGKSAIIHVNIGIGKAVLEQRLLKALIENVSTIAHKLKVIHFFGIDIDSASLKHCKKVLDQIMFDHKKRIKFEIKFHSLPFFVEEMKESEWNKIRNIYDNRLNECAFGIISAFTLHHLKTKVDRIAVINNIYQCITNTSNKFILIEPDVNNFTPNFGERLMNCRDNFNGIFGLLDTTNATFKQKNAIKYEFFYREVKDIIGKEEEDRFEKHELSQIWAKRLNDTGFKFNLIQYNVNNEEKSNMRCEINKHYGYLTTSFINIPLVALFDCIGS